MAKRFPRTRINSNGSFGGRRGVCYLQLQTMEFNKVTFFRFLVFFSFLTHPLFQKQGSSLAKGGSQPVFSANRV